MLNFVVIKQIMFEMAVYTTERNIVDRLNIFEM